MVLFGIRKRKLKAFLELSLSSRERRILFSCHELEGYTFSKAVKDISNEYPPSTTKLVLKRLKSFGLLDFGDNESKGKPLVFTELGEKVSKILRGGGNG